MFLSSSVTIARQSMAFLAIGLVLTGCNSMQSQQSKSGAKNIQGTKPGTPVSGPGSSHVWHMKQGEIKSMIGYDAMPQWGIPAVPQRQVIALTMLVPTDWQFGGRPDDASPQHDCSFTIGRLAFVALSPDKKSGIISKPSRISMWSDDRSILQYAQADNQQFARIQACKLEQPQPLAQKIASIIPLFNPKVHAAGQIEAVPGTADKLNAMVRQANQQLAAQGSSVSVEMGRIRLDSEDPGDAGTTSYLTVMQTVRTDKLQNGASVYTIDYPMQVVTFAPSSEFSAKEPMFAAMLDSVWINPEYQQSCMQVSSNIQSIKQQTKARLNQIAAQMAADNANAARQQAAIRQGARNYASQVYSNVAAHRSTALEHSSQQFAMYMGDQALYHDPSTGHNVQLPSGSNHAWASTTGNSNEYILTDSPSFDPNGHVGNGSWTQMQEVR